VTVSFENQKVAAPGDPGKLIRFNYHLAQSADGKNKLSVSGGVAPYSL